MAIELYKAKNCLSPNIINEIFPERKYQGPKLRSQMDFYSPFVNTIYNGEDSLRYFGPLIWNTVPDRLKKIPSLNIFKSKIKKWIPVNCPSRLCKNYVQGLGYVN